MQPHGSITALATPFTASHELDLGAWETLLGRQIDAGTQALVVAGSTGEASTLSDAEFATLLRAAVSLAGPRVPVIAGTGLSGTSTTIARTRFAADCGAHAALVVTPPYVRATQPGLEQHYLAVAEQGGLPVILYNVPGRTGCDLLPGTVARLATHPGIIGIKEACAEVDRMEHLLALRSAEFAVLSGDDPTAARALLAGADGVISVGSNIAPASLRLLADLARAGDNAQTSAQDAKLAALWHFLNVEPNPIPAKALLAELGLCHDTLRLPLVPLTSPHRTGLAALAAQVVALEADSLQRRAA